MTSLFTWQQGDSPSSLLALPDPCRELTVTAWVRGDTARPAGLQPLVSQWAPRPSFDTFSACDASRTDGLDTRGFYGAIFDGRYIYYCPIRHREDRTSVHGCVLRYDTHRDFKDLEAYTAYDAGRTDGLATRGFYGTVFDGRYIYFIPRDDGRIHHSRFLRYDTHRDFKDSASWAAWDADHPHSFQGAAFDGRYIYCCPGYTNGPKAPFADAEESGVVMRLDTQGDFKNPASYRTFDARSQDPKAVCFDGAAFDGRYVYFVPLQTNTVLRCDTRGDFDAAASWQTFAPDGMGANVGAVYDGHYLYFVPFGHGNMIRCDTRGDFTDRATWQTHDATATPGIGPTGYKGGFYDGRYIYYTPFRGPVPPGAARSPYHGTLLRYDTTSPFADPASWIAANADYTDGLHTTAYTADATDGRYLYAAPWRSDLDDGWMHGRILRYDSVGSDASFSLRYADYGHNGGLCAALPGPTFIINTDAGPFSVSAHKALDPGWHHLAGIYDGQNIKLYVDGQQSAAQEARGALASNGVELTIGHIGSARFEGVIGEVCIAATARDFDPLAKHCRR